MNRRLTRASSRSKGSPCTGSPRDEQVLAGALGELALAERVLAAVRACAMRSSHSAISRSGSQSSAPSSSQRGNGTAQRVLLADGALALAGDVAGAGVQERDVTQGPRQIDEVLRAEGVGVERVVERRVEVDDARDVDDRRRWCRAARAPSASPRPQRGRPMSPVDRLDLVAQERLEARRRAARAGVRAPRWWRSRSRTGPGACPALGPHDQVDAPDRPGTARAASTRRPCPESPCLPAPPGGRRRRCASHPAWAAWATGAAWVWAGSSVAGACMAARGCAPRLTEGRGRCQCAGPARCERSFAEASTCGDGARRRSTCRRAAARRAWGHAARDLPRAHRSPRGSARAAPGRQGRGCGRGRGRRTRRRRVRATAAPPWAGAPGLPGSPGCRGSTGAPRRREPAVASGAGGGPCRCGGGGPPCARRICSRGLRGSGLAASASKRSATARDTSMSE